MRSCRIVAAIAALCWFAGCSEGYPTQAAGAPMGPSELVDDLRRTISSNETAVAHIALRDVCHLEVHWKGERDAVLYPLKSIELHTGSSQGGKRLEAHVAATQVGSGTKLLLATARWQDLAAVRSDVNQLRAYCFDSLKDVESRGGPG